MRDLLPVGFETSYGTLIERDELSGFEIWKNNQGKFEVWDPLMGKYFRRRAGLPSLDVARQWIGRESEHLALSEEELLEAPVIPTRKQFGEVYGSNVQVLGGSAGRLVWAKTARKGAKVPSGEDWRRHLEVYEASYETGLPKPDDPFGGSRLTQEDVQLGFIGRTRAPVEYQEFLPATGKPYSSYRKLVPGGVVEEEYDVEKLLPRPTDFAARLAKQGSIRSEDLPMFVDPGLEESVSSPLVTEEWAAEHVEELKEWKPESIEEEYARKTSTGEWEALPLGHKVVKR